MNVQKHKFKTLFLISVIFFFMVLSSNSVWASAGRRGLTDSSSLAFDTGDGKLHIVELADCTDPVMSGDLEVGRQFCLCQGVAFRVAEIIADNWKDSVFHVDDVKVITGWNSDGPKEFFVDKLGMPEGKEGIFSYDEDITPPSLLSLKDAWYEVNVLSQGKTFMIRATDILYGVPDEAGKTLLDYRREFMAGNTDYKLKVKTLKGQVGARVRANPFDAKSFSVTEKVNP